MISSYFKIAWRNILRRKFYSAINIFGLSAGIAFALLIAGFVWGEWQVNKNFKNSRNLFALHVSGSIGAPGPIAEALKQQYPDLVANYYRSYWRSTIVSNGEKHFRDNVQVGDSTLITMFGFPLLYGDSRSVFRNPDAVVITAERARKFFGNAEAIGKILTIQNTKGTLRDFIITGVLKDIPYNSVTAIKAADKISINSIFLPVSSVKDFYAGDDFQDWKAYRSSYIELKKGINPGDLVKPTRRIAASSGFAEYNKDLQVDLDSLYSYHLDDNNGMVRKMIYSLSFTALFILLMAIVNFVNIAISSSATRLKEIGIRKVMGGVRKQLILQFLVESVIVVFIAVCFSLLIYQLIQPVFSNLLGKNIPPLASFPLHFAVMPFFLVLLIGLLAGIYPAIILSSIKVIESVKGKLGTVKENISLRKILVGFQFFIAMVVFVLAIVISMQVNYFLNTDLGFAKDQVLNAELPRNWTESGLKKMEMVRDELARVPGVMQASVCYSIPNRNTTGSPGLYRQEKDSFSAVEPLGIITDDRYAETFNIPVIAGHFFNASGPQYDSSAIVVNETMVKSLGWESSNEAIGKKLKNTLDKETYTICGVVGDFHLESKREAIKPLVFYNILQENVYRFLSIRIKPGNSKEVLAGIQKKWAVLMPDAPFDFSFMDETMNRVYSSEIQLKRTSSIATLLALVIVVLGIIGMVSLSIAKRTREIGIRKVLGATVPGIIGVFIKDVIRPIIIANLIAWPVAWLLLQQWLKAYAYRTMVGVLPFITVSVLLTVLTCGVIWIQTAKAAMANPARSLRTE